MKNNDTNWKYKIMDMDSSSCISTHRMVLGGVYISRHRNVLVPEYFLYSLLKKYDVHIVYSDGGGS